MTNKYILKNIFWGICRIVYVYLRILMHYAAYLQLGFTRRNGEIDHASKTYIHGGWPFASNIDPDPPLHVNMDLISAQ